MPLNRILQLAAPVGLGCLAAAWLTCSAQATAVPSGWVTFTAPYTDVDGSTIAPGQVVTVRRRPWVAEDDGGTLIVENMFLHDFTNQKGIMISLSSPDRTPPGQAAWTYSNVIVRHIEENEINRDENTAPGLHMDFLLVDGQGLNSPRETNLTIQDCYFHDGDGLPTLVHTGRYNTITLDHVRFENTTQPIQLGFSGDGYFRQLVISNSPNLVVSLFGNEEDIGAVKIINSPGAYVTLHANPQAPAMPAPGSAISVVPEPGCLALALVPLLAVRRRRRAV